MLRLRVRPGTEHVLCPHRARTTAADHAAKEPTIATFDTRRELEGERLSAAEEKNMARRIRAAENRAREAVRAIPAASDELKRRPARVERTRAGMVDRLEAAVEAAWRAAKEDPEHLGHARSAREAWAESEALRWRLAMSGQRIAHGEARKLAGPFLAEQDLVQEGYIGLLRAAKRFDPDRDIRFSTYARWWVRAQMTRAIDHTGRPVRLPGCAVEQTRNLRKAMKHFEASGTDYTLDDLAVEAGIDRKRAEFLLSQGRTVSLDEPVDDGPRPRSFEQFLSDDDALEPDQEAIHAQEIHRMFEAFQTVLSDRHRYVLVQRYGLDDNQFRTLAQVGQGMDLSRERVRQIEREALQRLRLYANIRAGAANEVELLESAA